MMTTQTLGRCYHEAFEYVRENGGTLVHGSKTVMGNGRRRSILHAWVLIAGGALYDPDKTYPEVAMIRSHNPSNPEHDYTTVNYRYRGCHLYSCTEAIAWADKTGSAGPWEGTYWQVNPAGAVVRRGPKT